ncbi:MAG: response regulator [Oscillospiraceae bacterium]|jgi:PAS domain S-box-containing protein|nr:response regulator [Oscillospiraceae bacterium]
MKKNPLTRVRLLCAVCPVFYTVLRFMELGYSPETWQVASYAAITIGVYFAVVFLCRKHPSQEAFFGAFVIFAGYTIGCMETNSFSNYFFTITSIFAVASFYAKRMSLKLYWFVTTALASVFLVTTMRQTLTNAEFHSALANGAISLLLSLCMLVFVDRSLRLAALSAEEIERFSAMLKSTPDFVVFADSDKRVTHISQTLSELSRVQFGLEKGMPVLDLFDEPEMKMTIANALTSEDFQPEIVDFHRGGKKFWYSVMASRLAVGNGETYISFTDITSVKRAQMEAESATRAKSIFLAKMSHELRTPMNVITGMSEIILREKIPPTVKGYALDIKNAGNNLLAIINDVLDFTKIENGMMELHPSNYLFASLVSDTAAIINARLLGKSVLFALYTDPNIPEYLNGDPVRVRQILFNLLSNAEKYTNNGQISLSIEIDGIDEFRRRVGLKFTVLDSGKGIKKEDIPKLFSDFTQVDQINNKGIVGTGLGLSITRTFVRAMGGDIEVASDYGVGSTFTAKIFQNYTRKTPFAAVTNQVRHSALIYEPRRVYALNARRTILDLKVPCSLAFTDEEFAAEYAKGGYTHVLVCKEKFDEVKLHIEETDDGTDVKLLALTTYGEAPPTGERSAELPLQSLAAANIFNDIKTQTAHDKDELIVRFNAPEAEILIVDDLHTNLMVAEGLMRPYGVKITTCDRGAKAVELAANKNYDIIFMDHMMPEMDGIETTNRIRTTGYFRPIVALTANALGGAEELFRTNGIDALLVKPIEVKKLDEILQKWLPTSKMHKVDPKRVYDTGYVPEQESVAAEAEGVPHLDGVDAVAGVRHAGGSVEFYRRVLDVFADDGLKAADSIEQALLIGDYENYTINVHGIKSTAANIGAMEISLLAKELESAGKNLKTAILGEKTPLLVDKLRTLCTSIKNVLPENTDKDAEVDVEKIIGIAEEFALAARALDPDALYNLLGTLEQLNLPPEVRAELPSVSRKLLQSDFASAATTVSALANNMKLLYGK